MMKVITKLEEREAIKIIRGTNTIDSNLISVHSFNLKQISSGLRDVDADDISISKRKREALSREVESFLGIEGFKFSKDSLLLCNSKTVKIDGFRPLGFVSLAFDLEDGYLISNHVLVEGKDRPVVYRELYIVKRECIDYIVDQVGESKTQEDELDLRTTISKEYVNVEKHMNLMLVKTLKDIKELN